MAEVDARVVQKFTQAMTVREGVTDEADTLSAVAEQLSALIGSDACWPPRP
ncbi:hypothetical protein [Mycobacterium sp.]|uniref:hypothetical protein n=1 Tax=Mycobacterium sp. TaxID=1785 RepID=UPI003C75BB66